MFIGRKDDLKFLNTEYQREQFSFVPIYGRRRVGKTTLIRKFIEDKKAIYFQAFESRAIINLERLSHSVNSLIFGEIGSTMPAYKSIYDILTVISDYVKEQKCVFIIDEYPYLAKVIPEISSIIQYFIDHEWKQNGNMKLILCGSSMSFMERQVLGEKSPLYGRKTGQIRLSAFTFQETKMYFPHMKGEDVLAIYGITAGIPQYLEQVNPKITPIENIREMFLSKNSSLFDEPQNLIKQELNDPINYNSILFAIASGKTKLNEISMATTIPTSNLSKFMENLIDLDIVERKVPVNQPKSKKTIYGIKDDMFRFWYRFVGLNVPFIEIGMGETILGTIKEQLNDFLGLVFEKVSKEYLLITMGTKEIPNIYVKLGNWWGTDPIQKKEEEIDILGIDQSGECYLFVECKWKGKRTTVDILEKLIYRSNLFPLAKEKKLLVISKADFTAEAVLFAESNHIKLLRYEEMFSNITLA